jgi:hypothetical protein
MHIAATKPLFAWGCLDDSPSLATIRRFLGSLPDAKLIASLSAHRGRGRDDYKVTSLWGTLLLTILLRHTSIESCLAELRRNEGLRRTIGIESEAGVPKGYNVSRFLDVLGREPHRGLLREVFDAMVAAMATVVKDLGRETAGDSTSLNARAGDGRDADDLPRPSGGHKEYFDEEGRVTSAYEWMGYKLHLLVDKRHEVALAWEVTAPSTGDAEKIPALVEGAERTCGRGRIRTLAYDKAADDNKTHAWLHERAIRPLIENRALWKQERERMLPGHDGRSNVVYDEAGTVYCYDKVSAPPRRRKMAYIGHEKSRGTLKYRCPAAHGGLDCASFGRCNAGKRYGMTVRVKREIDPRRFPPVPRATKQFERLYKGRTSVERVNARFKLFWGTDDGNVTGAARFHAHVGAVMVVHAGLALLLATTARKGTARWGPCA